MAPQAMTKKVLVPMKGIGLKPMVEPLPSVDGAAVAFCAQSGSGYRGPLSIRFPLDLRFLGDEARLVRAAVLGYSALSTLRG